jgi:hypothetical protein
MAKVIYFDIKIGKKLGKTRKNHLTAKTAVIKTLRSEDRNGGQRRW